MTVSLGPLWVYSAFNAVTMHTNLRYSGKIPMTYARVRGCTYVLYYSLQLGTANQIMEAISEPLLGVSLESVVEKASELERLLRGCKHVALHEITAAGSTTHSLEGRDHLHQDTDLPSPSPAQQAGADAEAGLAVHWHRLSTYIVGLEKEVQYYKQLVENGHGQTAAVAPSETQAVKEAATVRPRNVAGGGGSLPRRGSNVMKAAHRPGLVGSHRASVDRETVFAVDQQFWKKLLEG